MDTLNKKVQDAIKVIQMAAADAAERENRQITVNTYGGGILLIINQ